jgi:hypothetical protein
MVLIACNLCALAAFALLHWLALGTSSLPASATPNDTADAVKVPTHWPDAVPNMLEQAPLFSPTRSRPKTAVSADTAPFPPPQPPRLAGIVVSAGKTRLALLESDAVVRKLVARGDTFGGWRVISIESKAVRLRQETSVDVEAPPPTEVTIQLRPPIANSGVLSQ